MCKCGGWFGFGAVAFATRVTTSPFPLNVYAQQSCASCFIHITTGSTIFTTLYNKLVIKIYRYSLLDSSILVSCSKPVRKVWSKLVSVLQMEYTPWEFNRRLTTFLTNKTAARGNYLSVSSFLKCPLFTWSEAIFLSLLKLCKLFMAIFSIILVSLSCPLAVCDCHSHIVVCAFWANKNR